MKDRAQAEALKLARMLLEEAIRQERARSAPVAVAGRVAGRLWRSVASGGWD